MSLTFATEIFPNDDGTLKLGDSDKKWKINGGGTSTQYLKGDGTWDTPVGTYSLPTASSSTKGGIKVNGNGLKVESDILKHSNSVTAKTSFVDTATTAHANGGKIKVTDIKYDAYGHITGSQDREITLSQTTYTIAGLMGSTAKGSTTLPIYWSGTAFGTITSYEGNAATATTLATARTINGTSFNGSANITTTNWGTARNISIADSDSTNTGTAVSVNGSAAVTLKLPSTIKASITGNCSGSSGSCTGNSATATTATDVTYDGTCTVSAGNSNEVNFGGTNNSDTIYFGYRARGSKPKPATYIFGSSSSGTATVKAAAVYGAVWNDYAEYRKDNQNETQEPGRCIKEIGDGSLALTTKRLERGCEIVSDTFGFAIGQDEKNGYNTPIASNGRVLAYPYESIEEFSSHIGWPVCSGPNGTVSIMTEREEIEYPSRIIGTISEIPDYEEWGTGKVKVNGRIWIRIK